MNAKIKSWGYSFLVLFSFIFLSCEKDVIEDAPEKAHATEGKIHHLTIQEAPFLKPNVENFKSKNSLASKSSDDKDPALELDVQHIIEYDGADDFKSYSIPVIDKSVENSDYYFENLHVIKDGDKYETIIIRYSPTDHTKKFNLKNFTGKMEFFNNNKTIKRTIHFDNGEAIKADPVPANSTTGKPGTTAILPDRQVEEDCDCNNSRGGFGSLLSDFFSWIGGLFSNINISSGYGDPSNTGYVLTVTPPNMGSGYNIGSGGSSSGSGSGGVVFVPSEPQAAYQRMQVVDIVRKLGNIDATAFLWMMNPDNADNVNNVYYVLNEEEEATPETLQFLRQAVITLKAGGDVDYWFRVIIDKSLREDSCLYDIYIKLGQASNIDKYLKKFDSKFSVVDLKIGVDSKYAINQKDHILSQAVTLIPANKTIEIIINNDQTLPSNIKKFPKIYSAMVFVHEIMHADINRQLAIASRDTNINPQQMSNADWNYYINNVKNDFPKIFEYYSKYILKTTAPTDFQHQYIADKYRSVIKEALKQYDGNKHNEDFYNALSWSGLKNTVAWNKLSDAERAKILETIQTIYRDEAYCN